MCNQNLLLQCQAIPLWMLLAWSLLRKHDYLCHWEQVLHACHHSYFSLKVGQCHHLQRRLLNKMGAFSVCCFGRNTCYFLLHIQYMNWYWQVGKSLVRNAWELQKVCVKYLILCNLLSGLLQAQPQLLQCQGCHCTVASWVFWATYHAASMHEWKNCHITCS